MLNEVGRGRRPRSHPAVAVTHRPFQPHLGTSAKPDRRMWPLYRLGLHRHILEAPEFTLERRPLLRPERLEDLKRLNETPPAAFARNAEDRLRHMRTTDPHPHDYSPMAQLIL